MHVETVFNYLPSDLIVINHMRRGKGSLILSSEHLMRLHRWCAEDAKIVVDKYLKTQGVKA